MGDIIYKREHSEAYNILVEQDKRLREMLSLHGFSRIMEEEIRNFLNSLNQLYNEERDDAYLIYNHWITILENISGKTDEYPRPQPRDSESIYATLVKSVSLEEAAEKLGVSIDDLVS